MINIIRVNGGAMNIPSTDNGDIIIKNRDTSIMFNDYVTKNIPNNMRMCRRNKPLKRRVFHDS